MSTKTPAEDYWEWMGSGSTKTKKASDLDQILRQENLDIAKRHLTKYAKSALNSGKPFGEVKDTMQELIENILENI